MLLTFDLVPAALVVLFPGTRFFYKIDPILDFILVLVNAGASDYIVHGAGAWLGLQDLSHNELFVIVFHPHRRINLEYQKHSIINKLNNEKHPKQIKDIQSGVVLYTYCTYAIKIYYRTLYYHIDRNSSWIVQQFRYLPLQPHQIDFHFPRWSSKLIILPGVGLFFGLAPEGASTRRDRG